MFLLPRIAMPDGWHQEEHAKVSFSYFIVKPYFLKRIFKGEGDLSERAEME